MRLLKYTGIFLVILLVAASVYSLTPHGRLTYAILFADYGNDRLVRQIADELSSQTMNWGDQGSIYTVLVSEHIARAEVEAKLIAAGFERTNELSLYVRDRLTSPVEQGAEIFQAAVQGLPCTKLVYVFLLFDDDGYLVDAKAAQFEAGCL